MVAVIVAATYLGIILIFSFKSSEQRCEDEISTRSLKVISTTQRSLSHGLYVDCHIVAE